MCGRVRSNCSNRRGEGKKGLGRGRAGRGGEECRESRVTLLAALVYGQFYPPFLVHPRRPLSTPVQNQWRGSASLC